MAYRPNTQRGAVGLFGSLLPPCTVLASAFASTRVRSPTPGPLAMFLWLLCTKLVLIANLVTLLFFGQICGGLFVTSITTHIDQVSD